MAVPKGIFVEKKGRKMRDEVEAPEVKEKIPEADLQKRIIPDEQSELIISNPSEIDWQSFNH